MGNVQKLRASLNRLAELTEAAEALECVSDIGEALVKNAMERVKEDNMTVFLFSDEKAYASSRENPGENCAYLLLRNGELDFPSLFPYANRLLVRKYLQATSSPC